VIALHVVVLRVFPHGFPKMALAQRDGLIETLGSDAENESLRVRIQLGAARRELHGLHIGELEKFAERVSEQWITIVDERAIDTPEAVP
jgi:hypothetical protein